MLSYSSGGNKKSWAHNLKTEGPSEVPYKNWLCVENAVPSGWLCNYKTLDRELEKNTLLKTKNRKIPSRVGLHTQKLAKKTQSIYTLTNKKARFLKHRAQIRLLVFQVRVCHEKDMTTRWGISHLCGTGYRWHYHLDTGMKELKWPQQPGGPGENKKSLDQKVFLPINIFSPFC